MRLRLAAAVLAIGIVVACNLDTGTGTSVISTNPVIPIDSQTFATSLGINLSQFTKTASGLYYRDVVVGTGTVYTVNHTVGVYYIGQLADGTQFDARSAPSAVFSFILGAGNVIMGWDEGLVGMRIGGKRVLIVPPSLGYGAVNNGSIPGNSNMVFTVDAVSFQ
ncbi:MAG: FKBP-type peptidyl-prolyl cis-trans isomerase [Gemmatimonadota bacterium]